MKAVTQSRYGSADVLALSEIDRPVPEAQQVLIRVNAAGVNMADWHMMAGKPTIMRLFGAGFRGPKEKVRGSDVAGIVEEASDGIAQIHKEFDVERRILEPRLGQRSRRSVPRHGLSS